MHQFVKIIITLTLLTALVKAHPQELKTNISGRVTDTLGIALPLVNILVVGHNIGTYADAKGNFSINIKRDKQQYLLKFSYVGYHARDVRIQANKDSIKFNVELSNDITYLDEVLVRNPGKREAPTLIRIPIKEMSLVPASGSGVEALLGTLPGVNSPNEMSSSYTVRGGSYDENQVYINGVEIYRPQLIKSGRKEGLSIINSDLIESLSFSPGGFNASFGGKMSSVLDIEYTKPKSFAGSVKAGLMTSSAHIEGLSKNKRLTFLLGARYMTNRFLLRSLDTKANYTPAYHDIQSQLTYKVGQKSMLNLFVAYNNNKFEFVPLSQTSSFGNFQEAYQLYVDYKGFELDKYLTLNSALTWEIKHNKNLTSNVQIQNSYSNEVETFDIKARYSLNQLDNNLGSKTYGDSLMNIGVGAWLDHARNYLRANINIVSYNLEWRNEQNIFKWGLKYKNEQITDNISEWKMIDSAGYSVPQSNSGLILSEQIITKNELPSNRGELFILNNHIFSINNADLIFTAGARLTYWSINNEILFSPRLSLEFKPNNQFSIYVAGGRYNQTPFYKELRYPNGQLNKNISSQKSIHLVLGTKLNFYAFGTPFRLSGEIYHKILNDLIPYKFDNVRVVYAGQNIAKGKVTGIDLRLNGEFVKNAESWLSISFLKATHDIVDDQKGKYPAPADIRFSGDIFFQDYFPSNPSFSAHIKIHFSTGMPLSSPNENTYYNSYRMPSYRRVDIGFSKVLVDEFSNFKSSSTLSFIKNLTIGLEVFNIIDINNTISYNWLTTLNNLSGESRQFAVPNYLTGRSLNFKISCKF